MAEMTNFRHVLSLCLSQSLSLAARPRRDEWGGGGGGVGGLEAEMEQCERRTRKNQLWLIAIHFAKFCVASHFRDCAYSRFCETLHCPNVQISQKIDESS